MNWDIAAASLFVGVIIGLTGMGGGALMTPMLVILFNVNPGAAISSDVVASVILKPIGGGVHLKQRTVNMRMVKWLAIGSVPSAFLGAYLISRVISNGAGNNIKTILGVVLLIAAAAMVVKFVVQARRKTGPTGAMLPPSAIRPIPTLLIGVFGGLIVGMTSVGSGSLMIVMLMLLYPTLTSREMVGTDLVQAIPLVGAAALGHLVFGSVSFAVTTSVLVGAIPGVFFGAQISSRASDRFIRPVLVAVLTISSLKLLNVSNRALLGSTIAAVVACAIVFGIMARRRRRDVVVVPPREADLEADLETGSTPVTEPALATE
jgi:uncharacterized membrane protein YfcA